MQIEFTKAVASGNDFIIIDNRENRLGSSAPDFGDLARFFCRRKYSVGADGLLVLENSKIYDFRMRIFNPDGSEVDMCGNGIRCSALYAWTRKWCGASMKIETGAGILEAEVRGESVNPAPLEKNFLTGPVRNGISNGVKIKMTPPKDIKLNEDMGVGKTSMTIHTVNTGVPHVIHFVEGIENYPVKEIGSKIRYHKLFEPEGTNVDFVEIQDKSTILVRTYERGVEDETLGCGTGAVASAIISHLVNGIGEPVNAVTRSKDILKVYFRKEHNYFRDVYLEGKARIVFEGKVSEGGLNYV